MASERETFKEMLADYWPMCSKEIDDKACKYIESLQEAGDKEAAHGLADDALCEILLKLGFFQTVTAFREMEKWYA